MLGSWYTIFDKMHDRETVLNDYLSQAQSFEEKGIYIDALDCYEKALELSPQNYDVFIRLARAAYQLEKYEDFISACKKAHSIDQTQAEPILLQVQHYIDENEMEKAMDLLLDTTDTPLKDDGEILALLKSMRGKYESMYQFFEQVSPWHNGVAAVSRDGKWNFIDAKGNTLVRRKFDYAGAFNEEISLAPVRQGADYYYIDKNGYRKIFLDGKVSYLGCFSEGIAAAEIDGKYGFVDVGGEKHAFEYDFVTSVLNKTAAVKKNGKWALINDSFALISGYEWDDIVMDDYGFCSRNGVIFAKRDDAYILIDLTGKQISNQTYTAAKPFLSDQPAPVQSGELWGYIDFYGNECLAPNYSDAKAFVVGYGAVKIDEKWGFIDMRGEIVIEPTFDDVLPFSDAGIAPVKSRENWDLIKVYRLLEDFPPTA
jgi:tetratricopeptide (TPR) repeat protein